MRRKVPDPQGPAGEKLSDTGVGTRDSIPDNTVLAAGETGIRAGALKVFGGDYVILRPTI
ncbi:MAG: hypothetical protein V8Q27_08095 [Eubacteriales bacterium]